MNERPDPPGELRPDPPGAVLFHETSLTSGGFDDDDLSEQSDRIYQDDEDGGGYDRDEEHAPNEEGETDERLIIEAAQHETATKEGPNSSLPGVSVKAEEIDPITQNMEETTNSESNGPAVSFQPDCSKSNSLPFYVLCERLEKLLKQRTNKHRPSRDEFFGYLLSHQLRKYIGKGSWFPLLRLIMPDIDTSRPHTGMKEKTIATAWGEALGLSLQNPSFQRLLYYTDPTHFPEGSSGIGDLSCVIYEEMLKREGTKKSTLTVGQINEFLDELVFMKQQSVRSNHDWRSGIVEKRAQKGASLKQKRRRWVEKLLRHDVSALENKWIVRILLQKMEIGFSYRSILDHWQPVIAMELYRMNNNLKSVCTTLCNPHWVKQRRKDLADQNAELARQNQSKLRWMEATSGEAVLGNTIAPMLANKVHFSNALAELCRHHREYIKKFLQKKRTGEEDDTNKNLLPLYHPSIICEVKLDGERMVIHVRNGIVTMHTRRGRWYSNLYSPCLAPAIRRALSHWKNVDVILDGEVIAWDNGKQETIPFGNNRTVATARKNWMASQGMLEDRDLDLHQGQDDLNVINIGFYDTDRVDHSAGCDCWLRYEIFDVLHVSGNGAIELISTATLLPRDRIQIGSIIHLNGFQRKRILYKLIKEQETEVVIVPSLVIRPSGLAIKAEEYFKHPVETCGYPAFQVDSIEWWQESQNEENKRELYSTLQGRLTDVDIGLLRAKGIDRFYNDIVQNQGLEGIVLKDLNASYLLEGRKYWAKHKPDYEENAQLNDIDLLILGAYHGTGMGPAGILNAFLLGCVDDEHPDSFLAVCKVNGGGISREELHQLLESTGYEKQTDKAAWNPGSWFREQNHGKSIPDFLSKRSFQSEDGGPPVFAKKDYPELWIRPEDSVVLTIKASEIVTSDAFQAGITLRFPRIERVRKRNSGDEKSPQQIETLDELHRAYREQMKCREGSGEIEFQSGSVSSFGSNIRRFHTAEEGLKKTTKRNIRIQQGLKWTMPNADRKDSSALQGLTIVALEGTYLLEDDSLDAEEAREQGWLEAAKEIKSRDDLLLFISKHGGTPKISVAPETDLVVGGHPDDARVVMHHKGLTSAIKQRNRRNYSKVGLSPEAMMKIGGVLKWTFLLYIVHKWNHAMLSFKAENEEEQQRSLRTSCIKFTHPHLLKPNRHQYLDPNCYTSKTEDKDVFGISTVNECSMIDFKRALHETNNQKKRKNDLTVPWQQNASLLLEPSLRWIVAGPLQRFWPYQKHSQVLMSVVIYPDIFKDLGERFSFDVQTEKQQKKWSEVSVEMGSVLSCLPLARIMGAQVTPDLHDEVTHILCELVEDTLIEWSAFDSSKFVNEERVRRIKTRLRGMQNGKDECKVFFVSPNWIRNQWDLL